MDGWIEGWMERCVRNIFCGKSDVWMDGRKNRRMAGRMDRRMDG